MQGSEADLTVYSPLPDSWAECLHRDPCLSPKHAGVLHPPSCRPKHATSASSTPSLNAYTTTFGYDNDLVVTSVKYPGSDIVTHTRTALAQTSSTSTSATYEEAIWRGMGYDDLGRITEHMYRDQYEALWSNEFAYDSVGRVAADTAYRWYGTEDCDDHWLGGFYCDEQSGYWGAVYPREEYEYDAVGNRQTAISDYDTTTTNRITAFAGCEYTWDADGNITSRHSCTTSAPNVTFYWTSDNRLWRYKVTSGDTVTVDLRYDGHGRLARKYVHGSLSRRYIWNGETLFAELDASGNKILEYSYYGGLDNLHAVIDGDGEPYFAHKDGMGNVIALTDRLRNVEEQYTYERIWGGLSLDTLSSCTEAECNRSKYKGALHIGEEAGIYYMRNRWYEPHTGRFLSEDPIGLAGGINLYAYVGADPVNGTDPSGLYEVCEMNDGVCEFGALVFGIGGGIPEIVERFYHPGDHFNPYHTDGVWFNPWGGNWGGGSSYGGWYLGSPNGAWGRLVLQDAQGGQPRHNPDASAIHWQAYGGPTREVIGGISEATVKSTVLTGVALIGGELIAGARTLSCAWPVPCFDAVDG